MEWLAEPALWIALVVLGMLGTWLKGFLNQFLPSPARARLAMANLLRPKSPRPADRFRLVVCWLGNDAEGRGASIVEHAFSDVDGVELVRSARLVVAGGAGDDWRPAMRAGANKALAAWNADLAMAGRVDEDGKAITLWFVPREGDGTLALGNRPQAQYVPDKALLGEDFRDDLRAQIAAMAWHAAAPLADAKNRGRILGEELRNVGAKIDALLDRAEISDPSRRAGLHVAHGNTLVCLAERENNIENLKQAISAYEAALEVFTREHFPHAWAATQNNLGNALSALGERDNNIENQQRAMSSFKAALEEFTRERVPFQWAMTQSNLGIALVRLVERESGIETLKRAVAAFEAALQEITRDRAPLEWAMTQSNLGGALTKLGEQKDGVENLKRAIKAHEAALRVYKDNNMHLNWAETQTNLGAALRVLGDREDCIDTLSRAVVVYKATFKVFTRQHTPLEWAGTKNNLGIAFTAIGKKESGVVNIKRAITAFEAALLENTRERVPIKWATTQISLGIALAILGKRERDAKRVEAAISAFEAALDEFERADAPSCRDIARVNLDTARRLFCALRDTKAGALD